MKNSKIPVIRFVGYKGDWERSKLRDLVEKAYGGASIGPTDYVSTGIATVPKGAVNSSGIANLSGSKHINEYFFEKNISSAVYNNDLVTALRDLVPSAPNMGRIVKVYGRKEKYLMPQGVYKLTLRHDTNENFLISYSNSEKFRKIISQKKNGSTQVHLRTSEYLEIEVIRPEKQEQQKIGQFFKQLDDRITLQQHQIELLKESKQGFLQKMFPKDGERVPEVRFGGFHGEWNPVTLGSIVERITRKNKDLESTLPLTISAQFGLIDQNIFFNKQVASKDMSNYFLIKKGEFAYNKSYSQGYPLGVIRRLDLHEKGALSTLYIAFKPVNVNSDFLLSYYNTNKWHREVMKRASEGARNHGLLNISPKDFFETELKLPSEIVEQQKIGEFFKKLDDTIAIHEKELDLLKETKKGFLQKMFV
ncbi:restriction endonuclease subunit S [Halalkalibacillus halophilus]|uniref:restriction endonuclease subunit S n=1 Tax=Halalkalibacillus halophilus TaxID=392827 RepID=UPI0004052C14|nr:restriction endonuclease subunit S [Halalkalibacillus halophilus]